MATIAVMNSQGGKVAQVELPASVFEAPINTNCVRAAVNRQAARRRQGTVMTKTRGLVSGGGAKPWRQKGTGRARSGSSRSPVWKGGGTIFGPQPRSHGGRLNKKVLRSALFSCLSAYAKESCLLVVDTVEMDAPKTRQVVQMLDALKINDGRRVLFLTDKTNENFALSARNLPNVDVINCDNLNVLDLCVHEVLVATSDAVRRLQEVYA